MNQSAHREPAPDALEVPEASEAAASTAHAQPLIRLAQDNDMPAIQAIYAYHVEHGRASFEERAPSLAELLERRAEVLRRGLPYLVAEVAGVVAGYAYASAYRPRRAYRYTVEDSVYLARAWQGRGLGQALLSGLLTRCEAGPWRQMLAVVACPDDGSGAASLALHAKLGFREIGTVQAAGFKFGTWIDTVLMQRA